MIRTLQSFSLVLVFVILLPAFGVVARKRHKNNTASPPQFFLYTKSNPDLGQEKELQAKNFKTISDSKFVKNKRVKFISHGHGVDYKSGFAQSTKDAYLSLSESYNIILVSWAAMNVSYSSAVKNAENVGAEIAKLMKTLVSHQYSKYADFHHIGHSLGAQIGAFIAPNLPRNTKLQRVTGLDPWVHQFLQSSDPKDRLDPKDADFVDVITTFCHQGCNTTSPDLVSGTAEFYPNGGKHQPGCEEPGNPESCSSHSRAHQYYVESITTKIGFKAYHCSSYENFETEGCRTGPVLMGAFVSTSARGAYYLDTNPTAPFAQGSKRAGKG